MLVYHLFCIEYDAFYFVIGMFVRSLHMIDI